jgi:hypothetical protein
LLNRSLLDRKDQSNRYHFEELVDIYFQTCRHCRDSLKIRFSNDDCIEKTLHNHLLKTNFLRESLQCLQVGKWMSTGALKKYQLNGLFKTCQELITLTHPHMHGDGSDGTFLQWRSI